MEPEDNQDQPTQKPSKGYGKRPVWQWIAIYLVVAIVVYGLIYYFVMRDSGDSTGGGIY
jgi:flagellar basal body-associated protein FliL